MVVEGRKRNFVGTHAVVVAAPTEGLEDEGIACQCRGSARDRAWSKRHADVASEKAPGLSNADAAMTPDSGTSGVSTSGAGYGSD